MPRWSVIFRSPFPVLISKLHQAEHAKRMRALRNSVRDLVKPIGPKVTAYSKRIAKERSKIVAALSDLERFEQVRRPRNEVHVVSSH